jgi:hypothetical protein
LSFLKGLVCRVLSSVSKDGARIGARHRPGWKSSPYEVYSLVFLILPLLELFHLSVDLDSFWSEAIQQKHALLAVDPKLRLELEIDRRYIDVHFSVLASSFGSNRMGSYSTTRLFGRSAMNQIISGRL